MSVIIKGKCPDLFTPVLDAFQQNFADGLELGASFSICIDGELVIDIYGGHVDKKQETPWSDETLACVFSSGKAVVAFLIARAVSEGLLDYEATVASYWPGFSANGKAEITLAEALSHQAGLPGIVEEMAPSTWLDWDGLCTRLAKMEPMWTPGTLSGYHPQTFGFIAGEVYRRATGMTIGNAIREYSFDVYCGLPPEHHSRAAYMPKPSKAPDLGDINLYTKAAFLNPWSSSGSASRNDWMAAEIPASNMHGNAKALATILHPVANAGKTFVGDRIISLDSLDDFYRERCHGNDVVLPFTLSWAAGVMRNVNLHFGPNPNALGQSGFGGSAIVLDRDQHMSIAYVMNKMSPYLVGDPRSLRLINAVYSCL